MQPMVMPRDQGAHAPHSPERSVTFLPRNLAHAANTWSFQKYRETRRANFRRRVAIVAGISRPAGLKPLNLARETDRSVGIGADHLVPIPRPQRVPGRDVDRALDELDRSVAERRVGAAGVPRSRGNHAGDAGIGTTGHVSIPARLAVGRCGVAVGEQVADPPVTLPGVGTAGDNRLITGFGPPRN